MKYFNIRLEKKPDEYKGPKLVAIDSKAVQIQINKLQKLHNTGDVTDVVILAKCKIGHHKVWTTLSNERTVYELDRVKQIILR